MTTTDWILAKSNALAIAWQWLYNYKPSAHTVALALAPAWHETRCGDAWPRSKNWGASTLRKLDDAENAVLARAGLHPNVGPTHVAVEQRAAEALASSGLPLPHGEVHCDSYTDEHGLHPYFTWFASFDTDAEGAEYYLGILAGIVTPKAARAVLLDPNGDIRALAAAMYRAGYYTGFHPRGAGDQANIDDYTAACSRLYPSVVAALEGWTCPDAPDQPFRVLSVGDRGSDVRRVQRMLGITQDGKFGSKQTLPAVEAFRRSHSLPVPPSVWDSACRDAFYCVPAPVDHAMERLQSIRFADWRPETLAETMASELHDDEADAAAAMGPREG